ncbi:MAG TPA: hypothetical protein VIA09_06535 [Nitrososphaeraceae archaeon]|jgi:hypothetical protein
MNTKSALGFSLIAVIITATASILSIGTIMKMIYAQETASSQGNVTGTQNITGITCNEADDKGENEQEVDEDDDEPGDIDVNDQEDTC